MNEARLRQVLDTAKEFANTVGKAQFVVQHEHGDYSTLSEYLINTYQFERNIIQVVLPDLTVTR